MRFKIYLLQLLTFNFALLTFTIIYTGNAYAHILQTNGSIGAVLHIDPEDDPIVGQPAYFFLEFKDRRGKFDSQKCDCKVTIEEAGKAIYFQPLFQNTTDATFSFTFPKKDVYSLIVTGKRFTLTYDIRVSRESASETTNQTKNNWLATHSIYILGIVIISVFILITSIKNYKSNKPSPERRA